MLQKTPNVSYHLQTSFPVTTSVAYHLQKKVGGYLPQIPVLRVSTPSAGVQRAKEGSC